MTQTARQAFAQAKLYTDNQEYVIIHLPAQAIMVAAGIVAEIGEPFCGLIVDKDEVSLVIPAEAVEDFAPRLRDHTVSQKSYRLITFDAELDMELVGFMALVSTALAEAGVSVLPLAAYMRDHILISSDQFKIAIAALEKLKSSIS